MTLWGQVSQNLSTAAPSPLGPGARLHHGRAGPLLRTSWLPSILSTLPWLSAGPGGRVWRWGVTHGPVASPTFTSPPELPPGRPLCSSPLLISHPTRISRAGKGWPFGGGPPAGPPNPGLQLDPPSRGLLQGPQPPWAGPETMTSAPRWPWCPGGPQALLSGAGRGSPNSLLGCGVSPGQPDPPAGPRPGAAFTRREGSLRTLWRYPLGSRLPGSLVMGGWQLVYLKGSSWAPRPLEGWAGPARQSTWGGRCGGPPPPGASPRPRSLGTFSSLAPSAVRAAHMALPTAHMVLPWDVGNGTWGHTKPAACRSLGPGSCKGTAQAPDPQVPWVGQAVEC